MFCDVGVGRLGGGGGDWIGSGIGWGGMIVVGFLGEGFGVCVEVCVGVVFFVVLGGWRCSWRVYEWGVGVVGLGRWKLGKG